MHWTAEEFQKGANADTTDQVDKQGTAAEDTKIVNGEGENVADANMVEDSEDHTQGQQKREAHDLGVL